MKDSIEERRTKHKVSFGAVGLGKDKAYFVENLSLLVSSGMPILSVLDSMVTEVRSRRMKSIVRFVRDEIEGGSPMWKALKKSGLFKDHTVSLIRLGEESGKLVENLRVIAIEETKERIFRSKIRSAMMYPVFVLSVTAVVGIGIAWFILPKLALVFAQLKLQLPFITRVLIRLGTFLGAYGQYVVPVVVVVIITLFYFIFFFQKTKVVGQWLLFFTPGVKQLMQEVEIARFGYLLGTLLQAGLPVLQALESLASASEFVRYRKLYEHVHNSIEEGNSFQKSFTTFKHPSRLIPVPIQQLIVAGEQSGNLSGVLLKIGEIFENKADTTTKNLTVILEPILLVVVWMGVVSVALAVILPIYNLVGSLNT